MITQNLITSEHSKHCIMFTKEEYNTWYKYAMENDYTILITQLSRVCGKTIALFFIKQLLLNQSPETIVNIPESNYYVHYISEIDKFICVELTNRPESKEIAYRDV